MLSILIYWGYPENSFASGDRNFDGKKSDQKLHRFFYNGNERDLHLFEDAKNVAACQSDFILNSFAVLACFIYSLKSRSITYISSTMA